MKRSFRCGEKVLVYDATGKFCSLGEVTSCYPVIKNHCYIYFGNNRWEYIHHNFIRQERQMFFYDLNDIPTSKKDPYAWLNLIIAIMIVIVMFGGLATFSKAHADIFTITQKDLDNAQTLSVQTAMDVCFTPGEDCTQRIVDSINNAHKSVLVQAYGFTSTPIINALIAAQNRGVVIDVILDKSMTQRRYEAVVCKVMGAGIKVYIDYKPAIAHNKVMIIDGYTVLTGSFNFTKAAQFRNAENLLVFHDDVVDNRYIQNWHYRESQSYFLQSCLSEKN